jgi:hypothetical protein
LKLPNFTAQAQNLTAAMPLSPHFAHSGFHHRFFHHRRFFFVGGAPYITTTVTTTAGAKCGRAMACVGSMSAEATATINITGKPHHWMIAVGRCV